MNHAGNLCGFKPAFDNVCLKMLYRIFILVAVYLAFFQSTVFAENTNFSVSFFAGSYQPHLDSVNSVLADNKIAIMQDPNFLLARNPDFPTEKRNMKMPPIKGKVNYGVDTEWMITNKYSLTLTFSTWEGESVGHDEIIMFTRSNVPPSSDVPRDSRYSLLVTNILLGWKYKLFYKEDLGDIHFNIGVFGVNIVEFRMDALVKVVTPELSFASVSATEASGWNFSSKLGVGGEYYFKDWLAVGGDVNVVMSTLSKLEVSRVFLAGFPNTPPPPPETNPPITIPPPQVFPERGEGLSFALVQTSGNLEVATTPLPLKFDLDGAEVKAFIRFYF